MNKRVSKAGKDLLANTIRNVTYENRVHEERLMWEVKDSSQNSRDAKAKHSLLSDRERSSSSRSSHRHQVPRDEKSESNYYLKKLVTAQEQDKGRWGHSGYKELYPDQFKTSSSEVSDSTSESSQECKKKKRKREHSTTESESEESLPKSKKKKHKHRKESSERHKSKKSKHKRKKRKS
ncbi:hypothetical protein HDE_07390 [Halotydeus destructor]|nr:hypothetical protein HDE_07390 [Halotydeus destructor]